ncbi:ran-specific gtpase-activating [Nannochloropsis oceanica]
MADAEKDPETTATEAKEGGEDAGREGEGAAEAENYESTAIFTPVVQLDEVETKTHEEDEETLYKMRSKLYVFGEAMLDKGSGKKTWLERGIGEVKLLKHKENQRIRLLMRQEKTMKVIANHMVDPRIVMQPNVGSDRSWVWTAYDYAEGDLQEEVFALKFGKPQDAEEFKTAFDEAKKAMKAFVAVDEEPEKEGDAGAAEEAAEAFSSLKVGKEGEKAKASSPVKPAAEK